MGGREVVGAHAVVASASTDVANEGRRGKKEKKKQMEDGSERVTHYRGRLLSRVISRIIRKLYHVVSSADNSP